METAVRSKTNRHLAVLRAANKLIKSALDEPLDEASAQEARITAIQSDLLNLERLGTKTFLTLLGAGFSDFISTSPEVADMLTTFADESKNRIKQDKRIITTVTVATPKCPLCHLEHTGYTVKMDKDKPNHPYVICGTKLERVSVRLKQAPGKVLRKVSSLSALANLFEPNFEILGGTDDDIALIQRLCGGLS